MNELRLTIVGNLTDDPELRFTTGGDAVCGFTIAYNSRYMDRTTNEWKDGEPLFMRCTAWRDLAENVAESLTRGTRAVASGVLKQRSYEKDGVTRTVIEMTVDEIGPSLRYAVAKVTKKGGGGGKGQRGDAEWEGASKTRPAAGNGSQAAQAAPAAGRSASAPAPAAAAAGGSFDDL
jgi:single-strand DNA-binding protein